MKRNIILLIFIFLTLNVGNAQKNKLSSLYSLENSPNISNRNKVMLILNELLNYGALCNFSNEIKNGNVEIDEGKEFIKVNIKKVHSDHSSIILFRKVLSKDLEGSTVTNLEIENSSSILNENSSNTVSNNFSPLIMNYRDNVFIDKKILVESIPGGQNNRILNRSITRQFLVQSGNGQPASVFLNSSDGVIIPFNSQEKLFMVDNLWDRIIFADKDFDPPSGESPFYSYGQTGTTPGKFKYPSGISYGSLDGQNYRKIFVADFGNNRIQDLRYKLESWGWTWYIGSNTILRSDLSQPFDISHHQGSLPDQISSSDNVLWFTEQGLNPSIHCIGVTDGIDKFLFNIFEYNGQFYKVNPGRLDTYVEYNSNNEPIRSMLAYVDQGLNAVIYFQLDYNGFLPSRNPPKAFFVQQYPLTEQVTAVKFVSNILGTIHPTGVLVSSNDANQNGHIHISKVRNRVDIQSGQFTIPFNIEYLASTSKLTVDGPPYFKKSFISKILWHTI